MEVRTASPPAGGREVAVSQEVSVPGSNLGWNKGRSTRCGVGGVEINAGSSLWGPLSLFFLV